MNNEFSPNPIAEIYSSLVMFTHSLVKGILVMDSTTVFISPIFDPPEETSRVDHMIKK